MAASHGFPPLDGATVVSLACEVPTNRDQPLSRYSLGDLVRLIAADPAVPTMSRSTIRRILNRHALKPWRYRSWLFPRDPDFATKAGRVLDLYVGIWKGVPLGVNDFVLSADEKTSIQARGRCHPSTPPGPGQAMRVEHEYQRGGAVAYMAAWDVKAGGVIGRCEPTTGKAAFDRLVDQVMTQAPYRSAERVFFVVDNGSSHRGTKAVEALTARHPTAILVHLPIHASWLNQIEIYFSILQRKVLTPNDFADLAVVEKRLTDFADLYNDTAVPFDWRFTRADLGARLAALARVGHTNNPVPEAA